MHTRVSTDDEVNKMVYDHSDKAAGEPWRCRGAQTKKQCLDRFGLPQIESYYRDNTSVISSTLKDELRLVGKDARLFRPQDVSSYVEGCRLFYHQNEYLSDPLRSPIFCRFQIPGQDVVQMFNSLIAQGGCNFAADGSQWDARFPIVVAAIIAQFRIDGGLDRDRVQRYYSQMYNGYTLVLDELLNLVGQPSGHFNTSIDNSLGHMILMAIHACRCGFTIDRFVKEVKFYCCGDDLVWSTTSPLFYPKSMESSYNSLGVYLEFQSYDSLPVDDLVFVGVRTCYKTFENQNVKLFTLVSDRSFASLHLHKRRTERHPIDKLAKFVSLAILWFCDDYRYTLACEMFFQQLARCVAKNQLSTNDVRVEGLASVLNTRRLFRMYMGWETKGVAHFTAHLVFRPSGYDVGGLKSVCRRPCELSLGQGTQLSVLLQQEPTGV